MSPAEAPATPGHADHDRARLEEQREAILERALTLAHAEPPMQLSVGAGMLAVMQASLPLTPASDSGMYPAFLAGVPVYVDPDLEPYAAVAHPRGTPARPTKD